MHTCVRIATTDKFVSALVYSILVKQKNATHSMVQNLYEFLLRDFKSEITT